MTQPTGNFVPSNYPQQSGSAYPLNIDAAIAVLARQGDNFAPRSWPTPNMTMFVDPGHVANYSGANPTLTELGQTCTGSTTSSSNQITGVTNTQGISVGQAVLAYVYVSGVFTSLFATNTVVTAIAGTTVTVSNNASANATANVIFGQPIGTVVIGNANGTNILTNLVSTMGVYVGMAVTGTGVPANTTVSSVDSATQIHTNNTVTTGTGIAFTFTIPPPVTHPRIDLVAVNISTGLLTWVEGTEAATPAIPTRPAGYAPVAQLLLLTSTTAITNTSVIIDERDLGALSSSVSVTIVDATNGGIAVTGSGTSFTLAVSPSNLLTKTSPTTADSLVIMDAAASNAPKTSLVSAVLALAATGGFVNKFRNPGPDVWQRGTSGTSTTSAGAVNQTGPDGWYIAPTGASVAWSQQAGLSLAEWSSQITGATSVTDVLIKQRIEGSVAAPLAGQQVTIQLKVFNNTGGSITPTLTVKHATALDNWGATTTDLNAVSLQACPNGATTTVAYSYAAAAGSNNGLEVTFDFGNNFSSGAKTLKFGEADIRVTPGATTGQISTPPTPELRPIEVELAFCQRYLYAIAPATANVCIGASNYRFWTTTGGTCSVTFNASANPTVHFPVTMRIAPTGVTITSTFIPFGTLAFHTASQYAADFTTATTSWANNTSGGPSNGTGFETNTNTSALLFTGAEL